MLQIDKQNIILVGPAGSITVPKEDEITSKLAMLYEGECEGLGPMRASKKFCPHENGERILQTTLFPTPHALFSARRPITSK